MERWIDVVQKICDGLYYGYMHVYDVVEKHTVSVLTVLTIVVFLQFFFSRFRRK